MDSEEPMQDASLLAHAGRTSREHFGVVNTPIYQASTVLFPTLETYDRRESAKVRYGRRGTPTTMALEEAIARLERAAGAVLTPSGVSAITTTFLAVAEPGAHLLLPQSVYASARSFATTFLERIGVSTTFYEPGIGGDIEQLLRPETRLVWLESPGSLTFEIQDVAAIVAVAKKHAIVTGIDNTWSAGYFLKPLELGVDISVQAATKYIGGHSDIMLGAIAANDATLPLVRETAGKLGLCAGPHDVYLGLRGLRTLAARLAQHYRSGMAVAQWLERQPGVSCVLHPGLERDPGHALWKRDFTGATGLFGFVLEESDRGRLARMLDGLRFFGMGASWGGFESLLTPSALPKARPCPERFQAGQLMRIHVGLEDASDLIADLDAGLKRMRR